MKIKFCGADGTTTGSQHLLEVNGMKILLDCGLFQGHRQEAYEKNLNFEQFNPSEIDVVILSHAHIDHSGNLPNLVKKGYKGAIISTYATRDLCQIMLLDSARIQEHEVTYINKHKQAEEPFAKAIYTEQDADEAMKRFVNIGYEFPYKIGPGVTLTFYDAGHILGAAQIALDIEDQADGKKKRLLFSGDIGRGNNEIVPDPVPVPNVDIVIMESTYGGIEHESKPRDDKAFVKVLNRALKRGGRIYIPCFAVERTQQILYILHRLFKAGTIPKLPVFVDSPLAVNATAIFRLHPECFNEELAQFRKDEKDPFAFDHLREITSLTQSKELNKLKGKAIIIAASGMCEAGRIVFHLANGIENSTNTILFVGYCAEYTLGWKIRKKNVDGVSRDDVRFGVNILGKPYQVNAAVEILDSFSAHADHSELMDYFHRTGGSKSRVFVVHGEPERSLALRNALRDAHQAEYTIPQLGETWEC